jgi:hypothetical protein
MAWVSIHDYTNGSVSIIEYDNSIEDIEEEIVKPNSGGGNYEWMCMENLSLSVKPLNT